MKLLCILRYMLKKFWRENDIQISFAVFVVFVFISYGSIGMWMIENPTQTEVIERAINDFWVLVRPYIFVLFVVIILSCLVAAIAQAVRYLFRLTKEAIEHCKGKGEQ